MARRKVDDDDEPSLWDAFKIEPLDVIDGDVPKAETPPEPPPTSVEEEEDIPGFDRDDLARLTVEGAKALDKAIENRIKALTAPVKPQKPSKVLKEAVATPEPEDTTPADQAVPKGIVNEADRKLYQSLPYYGFGDHEVALWRTWKGDEKAHPTVEEFDKLVAVLTEWMKKDWCNMSYEGGSHCPTFSWGPEKTDPKRYGTRWRKLDRKFWKSK